MPKALIVEILADAKQFGAELDRAAGKTRQMGKAVGVAGLALAGGLAYGLEKSVTAATHFQSSMELIHTQAGVAQKQVDSFSKSVLALAGKVGTAPDTLSEGLYHLASQGLRGAKAMDALKIAAEGAKVGQANLEDVTNALGGVLVSGIKGAGNFSHAMGVLNATVGAGDMRMQDLADAMGTGLPAAAATAHVSLNQVAGALATFGDNNIRGAKAGTLLISTLRVLGHQSNAGAKALQVIGVNSDVLQKKLAHGGLTTALTYLKDSIEKAGKSSQLTSSMLSEAFGGKQATGIKILLQELDRLKGKVQDVGAGGKKFGEDWKAYNQTAQAASDRLHASLQAIEISIGDALLPAVSAITAKIAVFTEFLAKHTTIAKIAVGVLAGLALAMITFSVATTAAGVAVGLFTSPIAGVVIGLAALTAALIYAYRHSETFRTNVQAAFRDVKATVQAFVAFFKAAWAEWGSTLTTIARNDFNFVVDTIRNFVKVFRGVIDIVRGLAHGDWAQVWRGIKEVASGIFGQFVNTIKTLFGNLVAVLRGIGRQLVDVFKAAFGAIGNAISSLVGPIKTVIGWLDKLISLASKVASTVGDVLSGNHGSGPPGGPRGGGPKPKPPHRAHGGPVTAGLSYMVGENGPELFTPGRGGKIVSNSALGRGASGGGMVTVNVGPVYGTVDNAFAAMLEKMIATRLRAGRSPQLQQAIHAI